MLLFCSRSNLCVAVFTYTVIPRHPPASPLRSLVLNINVCYANGLTPAEVDQAPPLNVNPLPHLHTLKCQIPPQIIAGASVTARPAPRQRRHRNNVAETVCIASNPHQKPV